MSKVPWHLIQDRQQRAQLVVGSIVQSDELIAGDELTAAQALLKRLVNKKKPVGDYATTLMRDTGRPEVHFAFRDEGDARNFAAAVKAEAIGSYPGWASQRAFELESARLAELEAALPPPRTRPRRRQMDESITTGRRISRGLWTPIRRGD